MVLACPMISETNTDAINKTNNSEIIGKNITLSNNAIGEIYPKYFSEIGKPAKKADSPTASDEESHCGKKDNFLINICISATIKKDAEYDNKNPAWNNSNGINIKVTKADSESEDIPS